MLFGILLIGMRLIDAFQRFRQYLRQILSFLGFYGKLNKRNKKGREKQMSIPEGTKYVKGKLERDYDRLSAKSKDLLKDRYENIMKILFTK